jgi:hypothetical protein
MLSQHQYCNTFFVMKMVFCDVIVIEASDDLFFLDVMRIVSMLVEIFESIDAFYGIVTDKNSNFRKII